MGDTTQLGDRRYTEEDVDDPDEIEETEDLDNLDDMEDAEDMDDSDGTEHREEETMQTESLNIYTEDTVGSTSHIDKEIQDVKCVHCHFIYRCSSLDHRAKRRSQQQMNQHMNKEHQDMKLPCDQCERKFWTKTLLETHSRLHTFKQGDGALSCNECDYTCQTVHRLKNHINAVHLGIKPFCCDQCPSAFPTRGALKMHMISHTGEKMWQCQFCQKRLGSKMSLVTHVRTHTGEKPYTCDVCGKSFADQAYFVQHKRTHLTDADGNQIKEFVCDICSKGFTRRGHLRSHQHSHQSDCAVKYNTDFKLKAVERSKEIGLGKTAEELGINSSTLSNWVLQHRKPVSCNICSKEFPNETKMEQHLLDHATVELNEENMFATKREENPHKKEVLDWALQHGIKEAAQHFSVALATVDRWVSAAGLGDTQGTTSGQSLAEDILENGLDPSEEELQRLEEENENRKSEEQSEDEMLKIFAGVKTEMTYPEDTEEDNNEDNNETSDYIKEDEIKDEIDSCDEEEEVEEEEVKEEDIKEENNMDVKLSDEESNDEAHLSKKIENRNINNTKHRRNKNNIYVNPVDPSKPVWISYPKRKGHRMNNNKKRQDCLQCHLCGYQSHFKTHFTEHMATHARLPEKCNFCDYETKNKLHMILHKNKLHTEKPNYYCDQCQYQSKKKGNIMKHIETVHEGIRIPCNHCEKKFAQHSLLNRHMKNVHGIEVERTVKCDMCEYTTIYRQALTDHKKREHKLGFAKCDKCDYRGKVEKDLNLHISMVHPELPSILTETSYRM